jgi:hypothetical protein
LEDSWTYRFQRDEKSWLRNPFVFVDKGRAMPDGSPALLKTRQHLRRERAEGMWKDLVRKGWERFLLFGVLIQNLNQRNTNLFGKRNQNTLQKFDSLSDQLRRSRTGTLYYLITHYEWFQTNYGEVIR